MVRPARPTLSMWAHKALLNVQAHLWHCVGLGDVAVEYVVHFADLFYLVDEGFAHCAGLLGLADVGFGHCSPHMFTTGNDRGSAALAAMASNGNVSSGKSMGLPPWIQWHPMALTGNTHGASCLLRACVKLECVNLAKIIHHPCSDPCKLHA